MEAEALPPVEDPTALAIRTDEERVLANLQRRPVIDLLNPRQVELVKARAARGCSDAQVGQFLELCVTYGLDPYAQEAWCAPGRGENGGEGRALIMVGRDGLRKIARRNGRELDGDVVREHDTFRVTRGADRQRVVVHEYDGDAEARGPVKGAWAEAYDPKTGKQAGYFFAPLSEYRPEGRKLQYSPWSSQESAMIQAAAERQALRQATPLGGLLAEGEDARVGDVPDAGGGSLADAVAKWAPDAETAGSVVGIITRARAVGHVGLSDLAAAEMSLSGQPPERREEWLWQATQELERAEAEAREAEAVEDERVEEAEVVEDPPEVEAAGAVDAAAMAAALTDPQKDALGRFHAGTQASGGMGSQTIEALFRRGLLDDRGLSAAGRAVAEHLFGPMEEEPAPPPQPEGAADDGSPTDPGAELERGAEGWEREAEEADAAGDLDRAASARAEAQSMRDEAHALRNPDQGELGL